MRKVGDNYFNDSILKEYKKEKRKKIIKNLFGWGAGILGAGVLMIGSLNTKNTQSILKDIYGKDYNPKIYSQIHTSWFIMNASFNSSSSIPLTIPFEKLSDMILRSNVVDLKILQQCQKEIKTYLNIIRENLNNRTDFDTPDYQRSKEALEQFTKLYKEYILILLTKYPDLILSAKLLEI